MLLNRHNLEIAKYAKSYYIVKGVNVSPEGTTVTDGHYAIRVSLPKDDYESFPSVEGFTPLPVADLKPITLDAKQTLALAKALPKKASLPILENASIGNLTDSKVTAAYDLPPSTVQIDVLSSIFPDINQAMPKEPPTLTIGLSAAYLALLAKSAMETCGKDVTIKLEFTDGQSVVKMTSTRSTDDAPQTWTALLMPVRLGGKQ